MSNNSVYESKPIQKSSQKEKGVITFVTMFVGLSCFLIGGMGGYLVGAYTVTDTNDVFIQSDSANDSNTDESNLIVGDTVVPTKDVDPYSGWQTYQFADCHIKLTAPPEWLPLLKDFEETCGGFRFPEENLISTIENFDGTVLLLVDNSTKSRFGYEMRDSYIQFLDDLSTDLTTIGGDSFVLLDREDRVISQEEATYAKIYRPDLGETENIFYNASGKSYVIIWGGDKTPLNQETLTLIFNSIEKI